MRAELIQFHGEPNEIYVNFPLPLPHRPVCEEVLPNLQVSAGGKRDGITNVGQLLRRRLRCPSACVCYGQGNQLYGAQPGRHN